jgi:hypothetical protein
LGQLIGRYLLIAIFFKELFLNAGHSAAIKAEVEKQNNNERISKKIKNKK